MTPKTTAAAAVEFTHPEVFQAVKDGASWADPETDPTRIDWNARLAAAAIPFAVVDGRPVSPGAPTGIRYGRNRLGHWGEQQCADAIVIAEDAAGARWLLMIERADGNGWALPGGYVDPGETSDAAARRELAEETGLDLPAARWTSCGARVVPDPRGSDESWMVTTPYLAEIGRVVNLPNVTGRDDARRARWLRADDFETLSQDLAETYGGFIFNAHVQMLRDIL